MATIVITGAAGGIGRDTVHALASAERRIVCVDISPDALSALDPVIAALPGEFAKILSRL